MTSEHPHTVVIGGGIIGACSAWYLNQAGHRVTVIDRGEFGAGCSHGNCGYVSPSHVYPLTAPGQITRGIRGLFSRHAALRIRPRLSWHLWMWLLKFAVRCNTRSMNHAGRARHALLQSSSRLYDQLIEAEGLDVEWKRRGLLFVFRDQSEFKKFEGVCETLKRDFQVESQPISGDDLTSVEPALKPGLAGAWHYPGDAHLRPDRLMFGLHELLTHSGVEFLPQCEFQGFTGTGRAQAVVTNRDSIAADHFVVATGPLTPLLNRQLGVRIPIEPGKGYSITMPRPERCPQYPMLLEEVHVGITPFDSGYRIGSTMEFAGYDTHLNRERLDYLRNGAAEYLVEPTAEPVVEEWFGWRPMTWDGLPYIDRTPRYSNVLVAAGHNMLGLSMGTATGKLVSELLTDTTPHIDPAPFRIGRR